jgi:hypothetical protein
MQKIETFTKYISLLMEAQDINFEPDIETVIQSNLNAKEIPKYIKYRLKDIKELEDKCIQFKQLFREIFLENNLFNKKWDDYDIYTFDLFLEVFGLEVKDMCGEILEIYIDIVHTIPEKYKILVG